MVRFIRYLAMSMSIFLAVLGITPCGADETFPVTHNDTITVRVLNGRYGVPITHAHVTLAGGYDARDIGLGLWQEDLLTDKKGEMRLPNGLANLPFLQILVADHKLCQAHPKAGIFSVDRMRRDGLSAPNRCGTFAVEDAPGVFTVFVNGENGTPPVSRGGGASPVSTPAARAVAPKPGPAERQSSAAPTPPVSSPALAASSVEAGLPTNPSKPDLKAVPGSSDSSSSGSAVSSPTVSRSLVSDSAAPGSAYRTDLAQPPFAGMEKFYFTTPSTAPTLLLAPIPVVASSGHPARRAIKGPFAVSSAVEPPTGRAAAGSTSSLSSAKISSTRHVRRTSKSSSPVPSSARKSWVPASDSDPEEGSTRRSPRRPVKPHPRFHPQPAKQRRFPPRLPFHLKVLRTPCPSSSRRRSPRFHPQS